MFTSLDEDVDNQEKITFGDNSKGKVKGLGKVAISNDNSITNVLYVQSLCRCFPPGGSHQRVKLVCVLPSPDGDAEEHKDLSWFRQEKALRLAGGSAYIILHLSACTGVNTRVV